MPPRHYTEELEAAAKEVIRQYNDIILRHGTEGVGELSYAMNKLMEVIKSEVQKYTKSKP